VLTHREHRGPLVVQKALYPEDDALCQCIIVHPPGGIVGGDRLALDVTVARDSLVQLTTPGAAKWYRSAGNAALQTLHARVDAGAMLEWLPQGTIVYNGVHAQAATRIDIARGGIFIGSEIVSLGRRASGECFGMGQWRQRVEIVRDGALIWSERAVLDAGSRLLASPVGLNGAAVFGTFVAVGPRIGDVDIGALRSVAPASGDGAITRLPDLIVARFRGDAMEAASAYFIELWSRLRAVLAGRAAVRPRIWNT
jgi:urease accessory protein